MSVSEGAYIGTEDAGFTLVEKPDPCMHPANTKESGRDVRGAGQSSASGTIITAHDQVTSGEQRPDTLKRPTTGSDAQLGSSSTMSSGEEVAPGGSARRQEVSTGSSDSGYGGSALALASVWNRPIPGVAPRGAGHWRSHGATRTYAFMRDMLSPQYIADPLYVMGYKWTLADVEHNVERIQVAGHIVSVSGVMRAGTNPPELSDRGAKLWSNAVLTPVDASMQIRNLIPTGGSVNLSVMTQLVSKYHGDLHTVARDEGPLLRMLLMFLTFLPAGTPGYASNTIKMLRLGANQGKCTKTLHPYNRRGVLDNTIQIPANSADCDVRIVPLSTYVNALCAKPSNNDRLAGFNILEAEIVAIESHNLEQNWFMAFLIAHTTTLWWNCAATEEYDFSSDPKAAAGSKSKFVIKTMTRASCVYVPGEWKKIAIVVVDQDYSGLTKFSVPHLGDAIKFETRIADFTKKVFTYLGLTENGAAPNPHTMLMAIREMCKRTALSGDMGTVLSMVQELAFTVPLGGAVRTDGVFGASGVGRFDINAADYLLDKSRTTDLAKEWDDMSGWITGYGDWSVTPTGKFMDALFQCDNKWM